MRVLVTGHRGHVGCALVPLLRQCSYIVCGLDTDWFRQCDFGNGVVPDADFSMDIRDIQVEHLLGFDAVIHLAGFCNDPLGDYRAELTFDINCHAAVRIAGLAREAGVKRFLFASSCSCYGQAGNDELDENVVLNPVTPYGESKVAAEKGINALAGDGFVPVHLRAGTLYGYSPRMRFDLVLNNLVAWALASGEIHLKSDGRAWRPLVHVDDLARAYVMLLEADADDVTGQAFNIGSREQNIVIRELAEKIGFSLPDAQLHFADNAITDTRNYRVNCDRLFALSGGFKTRWSIQAGIDQMIDKLRQFPTAIDEFEGARFSRIEHIRHLLQTETRRYRRPALTEGYHQ